MSRIRRSMRITPAARRAITTGIAIPSSTIWSTRSRWKPTRRSARNWSGRSKRSWPRTSPAADRLLPQRSRDLLATLRQGPTRCWSTASINGLAHGRRLARQVILLNSASGPQTMGTAHQRTGRWTEMMRYLWECVRNWGAAPLLVAVAAPSRRWLRNPAGILKNVQSRQPGEYVDPRRSDVRPPKGR